MTLVLPVQRSRPGSFLVTAVGVTLAALAACAAAAAAERSIAIEDFDVEVHIDESSAFTVRETIRLRFTGTWNGIIRNIPVERTSPRGERQRLGFRLESVADAAGTKLEVKHSRRGADVDLKIRVPGAAHAVRTVVIRYRITGGLRFFDDHDELYWNVTGDEWTFPIQAARARIVLPGSLVNIRVNAFTGGYGSRERAVRIGVNDIMQDPDDVVAAVNESPQPPGGEHVVEVEAARPLGIHEGLTVAVAWNPGVVLRPSAWGRMATAWASWFVGRSLLAVVLAAPLLAFVGMFWRWWSVGRDPRPGPLVVQYEPPDGLGPAEVGTLIDNQPDGRDLIAALVDAAVKGVIRIRETEPGGWFKRPEYAFDLLEPEAEWAEAGLSPAGDQMIRHMFGESRLIKVLEDPPVTLHSAELDDSFYQHLPKIKDAIFAELVDRGYYRTRPDTTQYNHAIVGAVAAAVVWLLGMFVMPLAGFRDEGVTLVVPWVLAGTTLIIIALFALAMPARTEAGVLTRDKIRGFEVFLAQVEKHRLESPPLTPTLFEKFLPYAIALGVERRWAAAFAGICTRAPTWYEGSSPGVVFDAHRFTRQLGVMSTTTAAAMTSSPRSSGDSGFGGGGFSGGGSGGGGGSGW